MFLRRFMAKMIPIQQYHSNQFPSKMDLKQSPAPKTNALMSLFNKRPPLESLPSQKPSKKIKPNQDDNDALNHILSWRNQYKQFNVPDLSTCKVIKQAQILKSQPKNWGTNLQGILINIDWQKISIEQAKTMTIPSEVLSNGIVFIWGSKSNIGQLMDWFDGMGYAYAQNFSFIMLDKNKIPNEKVGSLSGNKSLLSFFSKDPKKVIETKKSENDYETGRVNDPSDVFFNKDSQFFSESQKVLYMFRKINKKQPLQLRHQRTSDVFFTIGDSFQLDWKAKDVVYKMIETLLINANYKKGEQLRLMQLWGNSDQPRKGWITVCEN